MKIKSISIIFMILVVAGSVYGSGNVFTGINFGVLFPSDSNYKEIYGNSAFFPELEIGLQIYKGIMIIGEYGSFTKTGKTIGELKLDIKSSQSLMSIGVAHRVYSIKRLIIIAKSGIAFINYKEEAMGESISGNKTGFMLGGDLVFNVSDKLYTKGAIKYRSAKDTINRMEIKLGGLSIGIGVGIKF